MTQYDEPKPIYSRHFKTRGPRRKTDGLAEAIIGKPSFGMTSSDVPLLLTISTALHSEILVRVYKRVTKATPMVHPTPTRDGHHTAKPVRTSAVALRSGTTVGHKDHHSGLSINNCRESPHQILGPPPSYHVLFPSTSKSKQPRAPFPVAPMAERTPSSSSISTIKDPSGRLRNGLHKLYGRAKDIRAGFNMNIILPPAPATSRTQDRRDCSNTAGLVKPCRACLEGQRCNQLGNGSNARARPVSQYTLTYVANSAWTSDALDEEDGALL